MRPFKEGETKILGPGLRGSCGAGYRDSKRFSREVPLRDCNVFLWQTEGRLGVTAGGAESSDAVVTRQ